MGSVLAQDGLLMTKEDANLGCTWPNAFEETSGTTPSAQRPSSRGTGAPKHGEAGGGLADYPGCQRAQELTEPCSSALGLLPYIPSYLSIYLPLYLLIYLSIYHLYLSN